MNVEDNMDGENFNGIFIYWSPEEINFCYRLMLHQNIDEKHITKYDMWQQSTYKPTFEQVDDKHGKPGTMEELHHKINFEAYKKKENVEGIQMLQNLEEKEKKNKSN